MRRDEYVDVEGKIRRVKNPDFWNYYHKPYCSMCGGEMIDCRSNWNEDGKLICEHLWFNYTKGFR